MDPSPTNSGSTPKTTVPAGNTAFDQDRREINDIKNQAGQAISGAKQSATEAAQAGAASVKEVAGQVKQQATDVTQQAFSQLKGHGNRLFGEQKERAASTLTDVGSALQNAADRLRQDQDDNIASYVEAIAGMSNRAGSYLKDADVSGLVDDLQRVARRNPGLFLGGMFVAGLAIARFAKASRPNTGGTSGGGNYSGGYGGSGYDPYADRGPRRYAAPGNYNQSGSFTDPDEYPGAREASHLSPTAPGDDLLRSVGDVPTSGLGATGNVSGVGMDVRAPTGTTGVGSTSGTSATPGGTGVRND